MDDKKTSTFEKQIGDTLYIIESVTGDNTKETVYEKIKRIILQDTEIYHKKSVIILDISAV